MKFRNLLIVVFLAIGSLYAQSGDTLTTHYSNATLSNPVPYANGWGFSTGQAEDKSTGKAMFFWLPEKSPATELISVLFDIETFNYSALDSFKAVIWSDTADTSGNYLPGKPGKVIKSKSYALSEINDSSANIGSKGYAAFNLTWDVNLNRLGGWHVWIGVEFESSDTTKLALKATANGDFLDTANRVITFDSLGQISTIKSKYNQDIALAIFPVFDYQVGADNSKSKREEVFSTYVYNGNLTVNFNQDLKNAKICITDMNGRIIENHISPEFPSSKIVLSHLPQGVYILSLRSESHSYSEKFILKN